MIVTLVSYSGDAVKLIFDTADCLILPVKIEYSPLFASLFFSISRPLCMRTFTFDREIPVIRAI
ncbi:MAG: hypothetical protein ACRCUT_08550, partial [Spirochaetota bacterium]